MQRKRVLALLLAGMMFVSGADTALAADYASMDISAETDEEEQASEEASKEASVDPTDDPADDAGEGKGAPESDEEQEPATDEDESSEEASTEESGDEASLEISEDEALAAASAEKSVQHKEVEMYTGYVPEENLFPIVHNESGEILVRGEDDLPSSYTTPLLPPLRNQSPYGTCWAFATTALEEINVMKRGIMSEPDLSELHLAYFTYNSVVDPLGLTEGDYVVTEDKENLLDLGGNFSEALDTQVKWTGAAAEETARYNRDDDLAKTTGLQDAIAYEDVVHIQDYYEEDIDFSGFRNTKDLSILDPIKRMVQKTGACGISFYVKNGKSPVTEGYTYSDEYNSYYNSQNTGDGHAVAIVGWDDDFPKEHFGEPAPGDGAFLIRNSWTTGNEESFSGYFWMSYYERTLWSRVYAVRCESADNYDNNYQYDGYLGKNFGIGGQTGANVYTAQNEPGATGEILQAVSFCGTGAGAGYTIEIYKKVVDRPDSGELYEEATTTGTVEFAGYNTAKLKKPVYLEPGEKFAVVVKVDTGYLCTESTFDFGNEGASSKAGESYKYNHSSEWEDRGTQGCYRIKAFTDNRDPEEYVAPTGIQFKNVSEDALEIGVGENFKITARVLPVSASVQDITWSSSAPEVVTVDKGTLTGVSVGTAVVTASVSDGAIKKEVTVTVKKKLLGISIDRPSLYFTSAGESYYQFRASYVPSDYVPEGTLVWASSDDDVMTVDNSGKANEHMMGNITITASVDGVTGKYAYRVYPSWDYFDYEVSNDRVITLKWQTAKNAEEYYLYRGPWENKELVAQIPHDGRESYEYVDTYYRDTDTETVKTVYSLGPVYEGDDRVVSTSFNVSIGTTYNITYHLDGGTQNPKNPATYISGRAYNLYPPTPPAGYSFGGWYKDAEHQIYKNGISTRDTGDLDLYAYYYPQVPQLTVTPYEVVLSPGESAVITAAYTPAYGTEKYTFSSYDPMVATVKENGNTATITGKEVGQTFISVSCNNISTVVHVKVSDVISFDENEITVKSGPGITRKLEVNVADRYSDKTVTWSSSDESIATVSNGIVDPADDLTEPAKVTITATLGDTGFYATCLVTVIPLVKVKVPKASVNGKAVNTEELLLSKGSYLSLESDTNGAKIYYALEGNEPSLDENGYPMVGTFAYDEAFFVEEGMKIKAFACKKGCDTSDIASFDITIDENDWGDINDDYAINTFFEGMSSNVPSGVWYYFGNSEEGYATQYYKGSGTIEFPEEYTATYYNGGKVTFNRDIHVFHGNRRLIEGRDYTVSYKNNSKAAYATIKSAPTVTVKGKGNYSSTAVFKFDIRRTSIDKAEITSETEIVVLTGSKTRLSSIKPTVKYAGKTLKEKKDYFLEYYDSLSSIVMNPSAVILNQPEETYSIVISAVGDIGSNFNGEMTKRINIKICSSKNIVSTSKLKAVNARGKAIKLAYDPERTDDDIISMFFNDEETSNPQAFVKYGKKTLVYGVDYIIRTIPEEDDYRSAGKHKFIIEGLDKRDA
ncbi:MAG: Ig-like domain-containing protein, partial [Butyrivibrio sp.]|nr:Ig-like domain-containing protein [Butyrivibrio sp.]